MPEPKKQMPSSKGKQRRKANFDKKKLPQLINCPKCSQKMMPHQVCPNCGYYKGEKVNSDQ